MTTVNGTAIAGGVLAAALIDKLISKGALDRSEVGDIVAGAMARLVPLGHSADIAAARQFLSSLAEMYSGPRHNG